jgi:hypothetical protein
MVRGLATHVLVPAPAGTEACDWEYQDVAGDDF